MKHLDELSLWQRPRAEVACLQQMLSKRSRLVNALKKCLGRPTKNSRNLAGVQGYNQSLISQALKGRKKILSR
jgi:hypothetical protein